MRRDGHRDVTPEPSRTQASMRGLQNSYVFPSTEHAPARYVLLSAVRLQPERLCFQCHREYSWSCDVGGRVTKSASSQVVQQLPKVVQHLLKEPNFGPISANSGHRVWPKPEKVRREVAECSQCLVKFGQAWLIWASISLNRVRTHQIGPNLARHWPESTNLGRNRRELGQTWANSWPRSAKHRRT